MTRENGTDCSLIVRVMTRQALGSRCRGPVLRVIRQANRFGRKDREPYEEHDNRHGHGYEYPVCPFHRLSFIRTAV